MDKSKDTIYPNIKDRNIIDRFEFNVPIIREKDTCNSKDFKFFKREDGTYYWLHCRKDKDDVYVDADELQLDLLGNDPILSTEYIMKAIY